MSSNASPSTIVRVVSYNLLSSHLAAESHFVTCTRDALASKLRGPRLLAQLDAEVQHHPGAVLCLQEVSQSWASELHTHLAAKGYHVVAAHYGQRHNGHMGVAIAFPTEHYVLADCTIRTIAETRDLHKAAQTGSLAARAVAWLVWLLTLRWLAALFRGTAAAAGDRDRDPYEYAMARENVAIVLRLRCKQSNTSFVVATYHMPCAFRHPQMMTVHSSLVLQFVAKHAGSLPYVLAGDFNWTPAHDQYALYRTGTLPAKSAARPPPPPAIANGWSIDVPPVRSAYAECGGEPPFTNWAQVKAEPVFRETLDYIWVSPAWRVVAIKPLHVDAGPLPTVAEPSDHLLIAATLELVPRAAKAKKM